MARGTVRAARVIGYVALALYGCVASPPSITCFAAVQEAAEVDQAGYTITTYGLSYQGKQMSCEGSGVYDTNNLIILAVGPANYERWPCHTPLRVCGPTGNCLDMERLDSCPGCSASMLDTTEAAYARLCGWSSSGPCPVSVSAGTVGPLVPAQDGRRVELPSTGTGGYLK